MAADMQSSKCEEFANDEQQLLSKVYTELRRIAEAKINRENSNQTLGATDLVHEAYLRLFDSKARQSWENRAHFFTAAAEAMRRIMIERARRKTRKRHGGGTRRVELQTGDAVVDVSSDRLLALDEALTRFETVEPQKAKYVKLRYFTGLSIEEAAELAGISRTSAHRYWTYARAWMHNEMTRND